MINVSNAISDYFKQLEKVSVLESLYQFEFNEALIPIDINFISQKCFERNIELKNSLHIVWQTANQQLKGDIIEYYIKIWGGIKGNSIEKMNEYKTLNTIEILNRGYNGISSWSKALTIHNPELYFIYDSRVAFSINCIQHKYNIINKYRFNIPCKSSA